ncbi:MAG: hypothetical protein DRJ13_01295 [Bacteroidetes bacterium]|nr:MAG: hypothetical protein DRJ13_01295 [Bacteroidota bacterium]
MDSSISEILNINPRKHIASLGYFQIYPVTEYFKAGASTLILGKSDHIWAHLVSSDKNELSDLLQKHHRRTKFYHSVEDWMIPLILNYGTVDWILSTNRYILDDCVVCDPPEMSSVKIETGLASYIQENSSYKGFTSLGYIEERLNKDISAGIMVDKQLVAWGLTHDDGSLGFLHVLKEYRGRGYGKSILLDLIRQRRKERKVVFGNIEPENINSIRLASKLGFTIDQKSSWIKLR